MQRAFFRGWPIIWEERPGKFGCWIYEDTGEKTPINGGKTRPCKKCGKVFLLGEPDPCFGTLSGVDNACCGHGIKKGGYIEFINGKVIRGFGN